MATSSEKSITTLQQEANAHFDQGNYDQLLPLCEAIIQQDPTNLDALNLLGVSYFLLKDLPNAQLYLKKALVGSPNNPVLWINLGQVHALEDNLAESRKCYQEAASIDPSNPAAHHALGNLWTQKGNFDKAISSFYRAILFRPKDASILYNCGVAQLSGRYLEDSIDTFKRVLQLEPSHAGALKRLGIAYLECGDFSKAIDHYTSALQIVPDNLEIHNAVGQCYTLLKLPTRALHHFQLAYDADPTFPDLQNNLAIALHDTGQSQSALELLNQAVDKNPGNLRAHSNRLLTAHYCSTISHEELLQMHLEAARALENTAEAPFSEYPQPKTIERKIKVGFVSPDLRSHPVGFFLLPLFRNRDSTKFEVYAYSDALREDSVTQSLKECCDHFHNSSKWNNDFLTKNIREHQIDILIDCAGHTGKNRLSVFARKPAPIQMTGFGYVNTTGLKAMDYFLTDSHQTPPGVEHLYVETLARLPNDYICYKPPDYLPEVSALPAALNGYLTLGCFNKLAKLTPETLSLWSKVLTALPNARLLLKTTGLEHPERVEYLKRDIHKAGIDFSRVEISGGAPHQEFLTGYHGVDIALDPIPYSGGLTTCEALWMGVPVVTLRGERFASLHSTSHLSNADLVDWITESEEEYIQLVVQWSQELQELQSLREGMRARLQESPLSNGAQYTADFESLLKLSFKTYCDGSSQ